ncbi:MAG TPA: multiheme c-type cytochrome [Allosphingosinicella sp.]|nr:multiheme c-type cytochrome [Allosphingosinicella sp.]
MEASRSLAFGALAASLLLALAVFLPPADAQQGAARGAAYVGVATCSGSTCHGRSEPTGAIVRQDELRLWQDTSSPAGAHSRAWRVLTEPRAKAIAARLGIGEAASAPMCLGCHATPAAPGARGARFQISDGVGCESCHGAASGWLASHYAVGGTHAANVARGMVPLDTPRARAGQCLDCHFGSRDEGQFVDHRIMAAGHPRISFELDLFTTLQQHHNEDGDYLQRKGRPDAVAIWAVGQAMALERSLTLFATPGRGSEGLFPEFYFFDCHSCHRRISDDPRFEPTKAANPGRPIPSGTPPYNDENMIMLAAAARVAAPEQAPRFERASRNFHAALAKDRASALAAATALKASARAVADDLSRGVTRAQVFEIIDSIAGSAISPRFTDYAGSVQAVMAVDTLLSSLGPGAPESIRADINSAYRAVRDPNAYDPREFRASLGRAAAAIRKLK